MWRAKYDRTEFAVELKMVRLEVALWEEQRGEIWVLRLHLRGWQHGQNPAATSLEVVSRPQRSSFLSKATAGLGASVCLGKRLLFLPGSAERLYVLGAEQPVPSECPQLAWLMCPACGRRGLCWAGVRSGLGADTPLSSYSWIATNNCYLFLLCCLRFLFCRSYALVNTERIIFFVN